MNDNKFFYDIHCHFFDLNHPDLMSLINRLKLKNIISYNAIPIVNWIITSLADDYINNITNLLSVIDRLNGDQLLLIEEKDYSNFLTNNNKIKIGNVEYDNVILTPLMMDFGKKNQGSTENIWYNKNPHKNIKEQTIDLFNAIKYYKDNSKKEIFKIYPFLGLNTQNYNMESIDGITGLKDLLNKYFNDYNIENISQRENKLYDNMGKFNGDIETLGNYNFCGIKVYPPLGYDPYPEVKEDKYKEINKIELEKVQYLYSFCEEKGIPITTHCGAEGYRTIDKKIADENVSPKKWSKVLNDHPKLKLDFAHFGGKLNTILIEEKTKQIVELMNKYDNVYSDISCLCFDKGSYDKLEKIINKTAKINKEKVMNRIMFGSDFLINLIWSKSYYSYLDSFSQTENLNDYKNKMCNENPERFLFGK